MWTPRPSTGEAPRLSVCALTRKNMGTPIKRASHYIYKNLAYNFNHRKIEPLLVTVEPGANRDMQTNSHEGHEFDYVLQGTMRLKVGEQEMVMNEGDSAYYDSIHPARHAGGGGQGVCVPGDGDSVGNTEEIYESAFPLHKTGLSFRRRFFEELLVYGAQGIQFCSGRNGRICLSGAAQLAMIWTNEHGDERKFTFRDMSLLSRRRRTRFAPWESGGAIPCF